MSTEESGWLARAREGDMDAFTKLFEPLRAGAYAIACRMVGPDDAEDIIMEAYLKAWQGVPRFAGRSSLKTWLYRIVRNGCLDLIRSRARASERLLSGPEVERGVLESLPDTAQPAPDRALLDAERNAFVHRALARLPDEHRIPLQLRYADGFSYGDIADAMGVSIGTVMSRLFYAKRKLKRILDEDPQS